jgi:predicted MFS family arabinose efflux permease
MSLLLQRIQMPRLLLIIMSSSFLLNLSFGVYRSVFSYFVAEELAISASMYGLLEGIREIPGLLTIVLVALAVRVRDERLYAISGALLGVGVWMYATANTYADLVLATLVQSIGFHVWHVVQDSLILKSVDLSDRARRLGQINSAAAAATLLGMGVVWLTGDFLSIRNFFVFAGLAGIAGAMVTFVLKPLPEVTRRARFVFKWQYRSFYILTLLAGARRHIVLTFAAFALVRLHGASIQTMAMLMAIHSFISIWTRPLIGRIIDRHGEQRSLSFNYAVVAIVFLGYAVIQESWVIYGLFVLDNVLTGFDIAVSTHAGRIIPREELSSSLATGVSINHIFGVMVPVVGGVLWEWFGPRIPFLMGVGLVLVAMFYSWNLDARTITRGAEPRAAAD